MKVQISNDGFDGGIEVEPALPEDVARWQQALNSHPSFFVEYDDLAEAKEDWPLTDEDIAKLRQYEDVQVDYPEEKFDRLVRGLGLED
jgi:hypothetical protein